jgi:agmatinase
VLLDHAGDWWMPNGAGVFRFAHGTSFDNLSRVSAQLVEIERRGAEIFRMFEDSHGDVWVSYFGQKYFHGTTFKRALEEGLIDATASVQAGMRGSIYAQSDIDEAKEMGFTVLTTDELRALGPAEYGELVRRTVGDRPVFMSFDIDFIDPAFAPGTGTPEVGGFSTAEALAFVRNLRGIDLVGCDVVEVSPPYDSPGAITSLAGATVMYELLSLVALRR